MTETKEKYISLSHCRLDGNPVCGYNDTQFLCLDKDVSKEQLKQEKKEPTKIEEEELDKRQILPQGTDKLPQTPEIVYDNFLDNQPRFHHITLYETKLRFYLVGSYKDNSMV